MNNCNYEKRREYYDIVLKKKKMERKNRMRLLLVIFFFSLKYCAAEGTEKLKSISAALHKTQNKLFLTRNVH